MLKRTPQVLVFILILFVCGLIHPSTAQGNAQVEPSKFLFTLEPGERITDAIKVTNTKETEAEYNAVIYDWTLDDHDRLVTFSAGEQMDTLDGLIKFNPRRFKLAPGQSQYVRFTLNAPRSGGWTERKGIIFFEETIPPSANAVGATVIIQVGATVYLSFSETVHAFHLHDARVEIPAEEPPYALLDLANEGQAHVRYQVTYQISRIDGIRYDTINTEEQLILPASRRVLALPLDPELPTGNYQLAITLSFVGTPEKLDKTIPFTIL